MGAYDYSNYVNKNEMIYNLQNGKQFSANAQADANGNYAVSPIDEIRNAQGFVSQQGLNNELGLGNGTVDLSKIRVDNNYDPNAKTSAGVQINPNTAQADPNYNPTAPIANNFQPGNPNYVLPPPPNDQKATNSRSET